MNNNKTKTIMAIKTGNKLRIQNSFDYCSCRRMILKTSEANGYSMYNWLYAATCFQSRRWQSGGLGPIRINYSCCCCCCCCGRSYIQSSMTSSVPAERDDYTVETDRNWISSGRRLSVLLLDWRTSSTQISECGPVIETSRLSFYLQPFLLHPSSHSFLLLVGPEGLFRLRLILIPGQLEKPKNCESVSALWCNVFDTF